MARLLLIEDRDGSLDVSLHEETAFEERQRMLQPLSRVLLPSILHRIAITHMSEHPGRAVLEKHHWTGPTLARPAMLEMVLSGLLSNMESLAVEEEPIEVLSGRGPSSVSVVMRSSISDESVQRDLLMWDMADDTTQRPAHAHGAMDWRTCREIVEAMGGEVWSSHCRPHGTALVMSLPAYHIGAGQRGSVLGLPAPSPEHYLVPGVWPSRPGRRRSRSRNSRVYARAVAR